MANEAQQKMVDLLNKLIELQPEIAELIHCGIPANEAVQAFDSIFVRPTVDGGYVTITGIISAIGRAIGDGAEVVSVYNNGSAEKLTGFAITDKSNLTYTSQEKFEEVLPAKTLAQEIPDAD